VSMSTTTLVAHGRRTQLKKIIGALPGGRPTGLRALIYHRVGGGSPDERDLSPSGFLEQLDVLGDHRVMALDQALDALASGDRRPSVVLTFDDGFEDVFHHAWPALRDRAMPFTLYLTTAFVGGTMHWDGSTARDSAGPGLTWPQIRTMLDSGLCTLANHTDTHPRPELLDADELDRCSEAIERHTGLTPRHYAYTWGIAVPEMTAALRARFRSAATGVVGENAPGTDLMALRRVPVRGSDPVEFFRAKLDGNLWQERTYGAAVALAKRVGARG
jgi:peptidoglycan/xylan/chitin deacetylase (PgdA/CDA1 family)